MKIVQDLRQPQAVASNCSSISASERNNTVRLGVDTSLQDEGGTAERPFFVVHGKVVYCGTAPQATTCC